MGVETLLSLVEGYAKPVIEKIENGDTISREEKEWLAWFVSFLKVRTPDFEKTINEMITKAARFQSKFIFDSKERVERMMKRYEEDTGNKLDGVDPQAMVDYVQGDNYTIEQTNRNYTIDTMLKIGLKQTSFLLSMKWLFYEAQKASTFVTSDSPFVLNPPVDYEPRGLMGYGLLTMGTKKIIPLSQRICMIMGDPGNACIRASASRHMVRRINMVTALNSDELLIARDEAQLRDIVKRTKIDQWKIESRVHMG